MGHAGRDTGRSLAACEVRSVRLDEPIDLRLTLGPLIQGRQDPCARFADGGVWRATRTPEGPATVLMRTDPAAARLRATAWGPGRGWALETVVGAIGGDDDRSGFDAAAGGHRLVSELDRRLPGLRIPRTQAVFEILVPTILAQKVIGLEAKHSYRCLVGALGEPAPGEPARQRGLRLPPSPEAVVATPTWAFHRFGVEAKRAETIRLAASHAARLEAASMLAPAQARARLMTLAGIGAWSAAEVARVAWGDADAVSVGDFHLPNQVSWALRGEARGDDRAMLELLAPYRGHRGRVTRLIEAGGVRAPRYGPRLAKQVTRHTAWAAERPRR